MHGFMYFRVLKNWKYFWDVLVHVPNQRYSKQRNTVLRTMYKCSIKSHSNAFNKIPLTHINANIETRLCTHHLHSIKHYPTPPTSGRKCITHKYTYIYKYICMRPITILVVTLVKEQLHRALVLYPFMHMGCERGNEGMCACVQTMVVVELRRV